MTHNQFLSKVQKLQKEATKHKKYTIEIYVSCKFIRASIYVHNEDCSLRDSCHVKIFGSTSNKDIENEYKKMIEFTNSIDSVDDSMTKMYKQFKDLKQKHPDALLLFRCGDLYEAYEEDAQEAAKILDITLTMTSKYKNEDGKSFAIAAFPHFHLDTYLPKLIRAGKRIAICDQIDAPKR